MQTYLVIGAGILGASTAYHLAKAGATVILVDRKDKGQATNAAAGIVCPWLSQRRNKAWYTLVKNGAKYYPTLVNELKAIVKSDIGYEQVGAISLHTDEQKLDQMEERAYKRREDAPEIGEITRLSTSETRALFPVLSKDFRSVHISGAARVNGRALRDSLINAAKVHGATFLEGDASLVYEGNIVRGIKLMERTVFAEKIIVTAGAWAKDLLKEINVDILVTPQKAQIVHLQLPNTNTSKWPVVIPPNNQYLLTFEDGKIVVGATHEDNVGFDSRVTAGGIHEILDKALTVAPGLANATLLETRVGFRPFTPGFLPVIGKLPLNDGLFLANGLGASGLTAGPYLGSELAKLAIGKETEINVNNYDIATALT